MLHELLKKGIGLKGTQGIYTPRKILNLMKI